MKIIITIATVFCINANAQIITTVAGSGVVGYIGNGGAGHGSTIKYSTRSND